MVSIMITCLAALVGVTLLGSVQSIYNEVGIVSFNAGSALDRRYKAGETIIFGIVTLNAGDGYNSATGKFTAPKPGLYTFIVLVKSVEVYADKPYCASLYRNGNVILMIEVNVQGYVNSVKLDEGDEVYVEALVDISPTAGTFSGSLLL